MTSFMNSPRSVFYDYVNSIQELIRSKSAFAFSLQVKFKEKQLQSHSYKIHFTGFPRDLLIGGAAVNKLFAQLFLLPFCHLPKSMFHLFFLLDSFVSFVSAGSNVNCHQSVMRFGRVFFVSMKNKLTIKKRRKINNIKK